MDMINKEEYLGDGLYASFDGFQVALRAPDLGGDRVVYMEPSVLHSFEAYVARLRQWAGRVEAVGVERATEEQR